MSRTTFRPLTEGELSLFTGFGPASRSGVGERRRTVEDDLSAGLCRPEWLWVAERGSSVVARAAFGAPPGDPGPGPGVMSPTAAPPPRRPGRSCSWSG